MNFISLVPFSNVASKFTDIGASCFWTLLGGGAITVVPPMWLRLAVSSSTQGRRPQGLVKVPPLVSTHLGLAAFHAAPTQAAPQRSCWPRNQAYLQALTPREAYAPGVGSQCVQG